MLKTVRLVEALSGEKLVHIQSHDASEMENSQDSEASLKAQVEILIRTVKKLAAEKEAIERRMKELERRLNRR